MHFPSRTLPKATDQFPELVFNVLPRKTTRTAQYAAVAQGEEEDGQDLKAALSADLRGFYRLEFELDDDGDEKQDGSQDGEDDSEEDVETKGNPGLTFFKSSARKAADVLSRKPKSGFIALRIKAGTTCPLLALFRTMASFPLRDPLSGQCLDPNE
ncbi:MAG: hypothetical protein Q9207_005526 [Kuettlingeria erythrocarpa]